MPRTDRSCPICAEDDLRVIVDAQLWNGHQPPDIAKQLELDHKGALAIASHFNNLHVRPPTRDNFTMALITYMQDNRRDAEGAAEPETIDRCDKGRRWALETIAKFQGFFEHKGKRLPNEAHKLLDAVLEADPQIEQRILANQQRQEPVEVEARPSNGEKAKASQN